MLCVGNMSETSFLPTHYPVPGRVPEAGGLLQLERDEQANASQLFRGQCAPRSRGALTVTGRWRWRDSGRHMQERAHAWG
jgi:hypothetical protein